ncbi:MAG: YbhN family protein [Aureliella sp.]
MSDGTGRGDSDKGGLSEVDQSLRAAPAKIAEKDGRFPIRRLVKPALRLCALLLVCWGVWQSVRNSGDALELQQTELLNEAETLERRAEDIERGVGGSAAPDGDAEALRAQAAAIREQSRKFWRPKPIYLLGAAGLYACAMLPASLFWRRCLVVLDQVHDLFDTLWAYFYGNLGKYFPGKAMVIVLRLGALEHHGIQKTATAMTIFVETLTMMSVGAAAGAVCVLWLNLDWRLSALAVGLLAATAIPTAPPVLRFLLPRIQKGVAEERLASWTKQLSWPLFLRGWAMLSVGWILNGLSLTFVLQSLPSSNIDAQDWWTLYVSATGACSLAVVAGFLSLIPGGAGVREVVLSLVLTPVVGPIAALCGALWMRLVWLATELSIVGILFVLKLGRGVRNRAV